MRRVIGAASFGFAAGLALAGCAGKAIDSTGGRVVGTGGASDEAGMTAPPTGAGGGVGRATGGSSAIGAGGAPVIGAGGASVIRPPPPTWDGGTFLEGGAPCAPFTAPAPTTSSCRSWWGGTLSGLSGASTCPCAGSPQHLGYGQTQLSAGTVVTGPLGAKMTGEVLSCLYSYREPGGYSGTDFLGLPYFGGGNTKLPLPASTVTAARAVCALPTGGATLPSTYAEMAKRLVGAWFVCPSPQSPGPAPGPPYDGIILNPDGGYEWLAAQGDRFVKVTDCSNSGLWGLDPAQAVQLNLFGDAGQYISLVQGFSTAPTISVAMSSDFGTATSWVQVQ